MFSNENTYAYWNLSTFSWTFSINPPFKALRSCFVFDNGTAAEVARIARRQDTEFASSTSLPGVLLFPRNEPTFALFDFGILDKI